MKKIITTQLHLFITLLAMLFCFSAKADVGMLDAAAWISMEETDTVVVPLIHAPFAKKVLGDRKVGEYTMPVFMREFKARRNVYRATLYVCGLGHFNVYLDGQKVGDHFLDPGWTLYDKEALYVKFDVTRWFKEDADNVVAEFAHRIKRGEHELRVELGGGFTMFHVEDTTNSSARMVLQSYACVSIWNTRRVATTTSSRMENGAWAKARLPSAASMAARMWT